MWAAFNPLRTAIYHPISPLLLPLLLPIFGGELNLRSWLPEAYAKLKTADERTRTADLESHYEVDSVPCT
jgi:hypothetical protein